MSLEEIKTKILEEARAEAAALERSSLAEAKRIRDHEHLAAQREAEAIARQAGHQAEALRQAVEVEQAMAARQASLDLKQDLIGQAFEAAGRLLAGSPDDAYRSFLGVLLKAVPADFAVNSAEIPENRKEISLKAIGGAFGGLPPDRIKVRPGLTGGLYLTGEKYDLDLTWSRLVEESQPGLTAPVGRLIFPEEK